MKIRAFGKVIEILVRFYNSKPGGFRRAQGVIQLKHGETPENIIRSVRDCESACAGVEFVGDPDGAVKTLVEECTLALGWHAGFPHGGPSDFEMQTSGEIYERLRTALARVRLDDDAEKGEK